jgi:hypothetical protein
VSPRWRNRAWYSDYPLAPALMSRQLNAGGELRRRE